MLSFGVGCDGVVPGMWCVCVLRATLESVQTAGTKVRKLQEPALAMKPYYTFHRTVVITTLVV